jgi:putative membrane protein
MAENKEPKQEEPEQIKLMKQMVDLAIERTNMAAERSKMSADRSRMSAERSRMSAERSEMSAERSYMNAERTLSVWVRTAMALMIFGIAIDRFSLLLRRLPMNPARIHVYSNDLSNWGGLALVALGVVMALTTGARFLAYAAVYRREHQLPWYHGPFLAPFFAFMVAIFGVGLLVIMFVFTD